MAVAQYRDFAHRDILPATWTDAIERFLTARENFVVRRASANSIEVPAGVVGGHDLGPAGLIIGGKPRWIEATTSRTVAGGAGTYDIWVVGSANSFAAGAPAVGEIDNTFYGFELRVVASGGAAPAGVLAGGQAIAVTRKVRTVTWDGAAITGLNRLATDGPVDDLLAVHGVKLGVAQDANLYRTAAAAIKTDGSLDAGTDLTARSAAAAQVLTGAGGPSAQAGVKFGSAGDANLYRTAAGALKTDGTLAAAGGYAIGSPLGGGVPAYQSQQVAAQTVIRNKLLAADANDAFHVLGDGKVEWGAGGGTAVDTNLYRGGADQLKTDDQFVSLSYLVAQSGAASQVAVGATALATPGAGIVFGSAGDTNLYRTAADTLKTDDAFQSASYVYAQMGGANQVTVGALAPATPGAGIALGSALDTNLYRSAAAILATDGALKSSGQFRAVSATKTANYTVLATDDVVRGDSTAGGFNVTLLTAVGRSGRVYTVVNVGTAGTVTLAVQAGEALDGTVNGTLGMTAGGATTRRTVISDGAGWRTI